MSVQHRKLWYLKCDEPGCVVYSPFDKDNPDAYELEQEMARLGGWLVSRERHLCPKHKMEMLNTSTTDAEGG
jgi:hypothetical protein